LLEKFFFQKTAAGVPRQSTARRAAERPPAELLPR